MKNKLIAAAISGLAALTVVTAAPAQAADATGDVYVSLSDGSKFVQNAWKWHDWFGLDNEVVQTGDFNGDGKDDVVTFTRGDAGKTYVALSGGGGFGQSAVWHNHFAVGAETPLVGDFNGDGKDDIVTFTRGTAGDVYVSLSDGGRFVQDGWKWHDWFAIGGEVPLVGDFNGDGKDDIATATRGDTGDVFVALSTGSGFTGTSVKWHDWFGIGGEILDVGDFNGDGKDDLVTFTRGDLADVFVALSDGSKFIGTTQKWHDWFAMGAEVPEVGDFDGDGKADIATFTRGGAADVFVATSTGTVFSGTSVKWHDFFAANNETPRIGDFNGDRKADVSTFLLGGSTSLRTHIANIANGEVGIGRPACEKYGPCVKYDWCAMFATWTWEAAGIKGVPRGSWVATALGSWGQQRGLFKARPGGQFGNPAVGDWVIYGAPGSGTGGHVSVVVAVNNNGTITTVDGNSGSNSRVTRNTINPVTAKAGGRNVGISGYVTRPGA